jgi:dedicator of cytokinesis protein 3
MDDLGLPQQSQFHRKETLCLLIMDYLGKEHQLTSLTQELTLCPGKGKAWEKAIEVSRDLAEQHQNVTFN